MGTNPPKIERGQGKEKVKREQEKEKVKREQRTENVKREQGEEMIKKDAQVGKERKPKRGKEGKRMQIKGKRVEEEKRKQGEMEGRTKKLGGIKERKEAEGEKNKIPEETRRKIITEIGKIKAEREEKERKMGKKLQQRRRGEAKIKENQEIVIKRKKEIMLWQTQLTTSFGVSIFHWSKFWKKTKYQRKQ